MLMHRNYDPVKQLDWLLRDICANLGFCGGRLKGQDLLAMADPLTPSLFANAVLAAEGIDQEFETRWRHLVEQKFRERFGEVLSR